MKQNRKTDKFDNLLTEYYKNRKGNFKVSIPPFPFVPVTEEKITQKRRFLLNTLFTTGVLFMSVLFILTAGKQSELALIMERVIENTSAAEHIKSGLNSLFEILSNSLM